MMRLLAVWLAVCALCAVEAKVVINEISYHPPENDDSLEFIELFNSGGETADLTGWKFTKGIQYEFPNGTEIKGKGFLVLARDGAAFKKHYGIDAAGVFKSSVKNTGENLELRNAEGKRADKVNFKDNAPWPQSADGQTATLERISPGAESDDPRNWASSPLSKEPGKPAGTPGKQNANYAEVLPPVIRDVSFEPRQPSPSQTVTVSAVVRDQSDGLESVALFYRVAKGGAQKEERIAMSKGAEGRFTATIPAQAEDSVVRFQIEAANTKGSKRLEPGANEPSPAYSYFVHEKFGPAKIARGYVIHMNEADFKKAQKQSPQNRGPGMSEADQERFMARTTFENGTEFSPLWVEICQQLSRAQLMKIRETVRKQMEEREKSGEALETSDEPMKEARELMAAFYKNFGEAVGSELNDGQRAALTKWAESKTKIAAGQPIWTAETILQRLCNVEGAFLYVSMRAELSESAFENLKASCARFVSERQKIRQTVMEVMQGKGDRVAAEAKMEALNKEVDKEFGALLPDDAARAGLAEWRENSHPFRMRGARGGGNDTQPVRGANAFVYVPPEGGSAELYDFIDVKPRGAGYKVHFAKGRALKGMTSINLIFEYNDRFVLAEHLAYEVYHKAGNAAPKSEFVRLHMDGRPFGYHLLVEQPNRAFLKRNKLRDDGNLYKILWYERGVVKQHEKKTNPQSGHDDLLALVEALEKTKGDEQWAVIKKNFNVEQVINYFAVNMVLSHWDGYFNNYFTYHDVNGTGKWEMYPWDQDKTWGFHDATGDAVFFDMPVTFGMEGDRPPGFPKDRPPPQGFNGGTWWRPGGVFSKPLLANPQFRKQFLARTREILETVYTEKEFSPIIDGLKEKLGEEVRIRAEILKEKPEAAMARLEKNVESLKDHLMKRCEFLLAQDEIKQAGKLERAALK
jgi:hypothetical protein